MKLYSLGLIKQTNVRDRRCVISGVANPEIWIQSGDWDHFNFEVGHIFPFEKATTCSTGVNIIITVTDGLEDQLLLG